MFYYEEEYFDDANVDPDGRDLVSINPVTSEEIWSGTQSSVDDVVHAISSARLNLPIWSELGFKKRLSILEAYTRLLEEKSDVFAQLISDEMGKPLWEAKQEVAAMIKKLPISVTAYEDRCRKREQDLGGKKSITRHKPIGVLAVIGPFNFPGHLPNGHIIPALLAGNCIVFKPSEQTPKVGEFLVELFNEAGLPQGVLNLIQGGIRPSMVLTNHPDVDGILFTGSSAVGQQLQRILIRHPNKLIALEMGGNNPFIVTDSSYINETVSSIIHSAFITSGQRCTCARRLILTRDKNNKLLLDKLIDTVSKIKIGFPHQNKDYFLGPVISNDAASHILNFQDYLKARGANSLLNINRLDENKPFLTPGIWDVSYVSSREDIECFGPLLQLIWVDDFEQAILEANNTNYGLSATLFTDDKSKYEQFYQRSRAGLVNWNCPTTGANSAAPFGGVGFSGNYRPSAYYAADYCAFPVASLEMTKPSVVGPLPGVKL